VWMRMSGTWVGYEIDEEHPVTIARRALDSKRKACMLGQRNYGKDGDQDE